MNTDITALADFDIDAWINEIETPTITKTVYTRGDLLGVYGELTEEREKLLQAISALADSLPDDDTESNDERAEFDKLRAKTQDVDRRRAEIRDTYANHKATFYFTTIDQATRERINTEHPDHKKPGGFIQVTDQLLRLFLASATHATITRDDMTIRVETKTWTPKQLLQFLNKIGEGQAALLWQAFLGIGDAITALDDQPEH